MKKNLSIFLLMMLTVMLLLTGCSVSQSDNEKSDSKVAFSTENAKKSFVIPNSIPGWKVVSRYDYDHDNIADLFWYRESNTGEVRIWLLDGNGSAKPNGDIVMPSPTWPPSGWKVVGVGDYNNDGNADLLWRRADDTGEVRVWLFDGNGGIIKDAKLSEVITGGYVFPGYYYIRNKWQPQGHPKYIRYSPSNLSNPNIKLACEGYDGSNLDTWKWQMILNKNGTYTFKLKNVSNWYLIDCANTQNNTYLPDNGVFGIYGYGVGDFYWNPYYSDWNIILNSEGLAMIQNAITGRYMNIEYQWINIREYFYVFMYENAPSDWLSAQWIIEPADYDLTRVY